MGERVDTWSLRGTIEKSLCTVDSPILGHCISFNRSRSLSQRVAITRPCDLLFPFFMLKRLTESLLLVSKIQEEGE